MLQFLSDFADEIERSAEDAERQVSDGIDAAWYTATGADDYDSPPPPTREAVEEYNAQARAAGLPELEWNQELADRAAEEYRAQQAAQDRGFWDRYVGDPLASLAGLAQGTAQTVQWGAIALIVLVGVGLAVSVGVAIWMWGPRLAAASGDFFEFLSGGVV